MRLLCVGDLFFRGEEIARALEDLKRDGIDVVWRNWGMEGSGWEDKLLEVERKGPVDELLPDEIRQEMIQSDFIVVHYCPVTAAAIEMSEKLKLIGVLRVGYENVDVRSAMKRGASVVNSPGRSANAVAEFTIGMIVSESRNIARSYHALKNGVWMKDFGNRAYLSELVNQVIGIIGFGGVGSNVAGKLKGFSVREILVHDPLVPEERIRDAGCRPVDLETLFRESDYVTVHARGQRVVTKELISLLKPTAYLINTARAGLVDNEALYEALKQKRIGGAALDVFETEPLPPNSPWFRLENATLTPHIAGDTINTRLNAAYMVKEEIQRYLRGEKLRSPLLAE